MSYYSASYGPLLLGVNDLMSHILVFIVHFALAVSVVVKNT